MLSKLILWFLKIVWNSRKKKILLALFKIQNGGEIQDGRQTIKCFRFVENDANNCNFGFWNIRLFQTITWLNNSKWRRSLHFSVMDHNFCIFQPIFKTQHVFEAQFYKLSIFTLIFMSKMAEIFKMAFFRFFMFFFKLWRP
jgi:hypothetical protein